MKSAPADTRFSSWDKALYTLATVEQANPAGIAQSSFKALFDGFFYINPIDEPFRWAYSRLSTLESEELPFSNERAVIEGRLAVARSDYGRGLREFRKRMDDPAFFLCRPALISDLGRAIQYGSARSAENQLFEDWEALLAAESDTDKADNELWETADVVLVRYRLLFYAGRIQRQLGKHDTAAALFERAIPFAQSPIDIDASIWYFLTETLRETPDNAADLALEYLPQWQDLSYFDDFLDDLSSYLCGKGQWKRIAELFYLLRLRDKGGTSAQYAYLIGRAIEEGYLTLSDITQGESGGTAHSTKSEAQKQEAALIAPFFFNIAYSNPQAPLYYRICSSIRLKTHLLPFSTDAAALDYETFDYTAFDTGALPHADDTAFLLGFFEYGARSYVSPHIQKTRVGLDTAELRIIAAAYAKDGQYTEANQLVSYYSSRENYVPTRADYQITHPRPFAELIEAQARDNKVPELVLYGLIRTESLFRETIKSSVGAEGLMQLMPATALETAARMARAGLPNYIVDGTVDSLDPDINVHIGAYYLSGLNDMFKSTVLALCAYNGGIGRVRRWRAAHPDYTEDLFLETVEFRETRSYGKRVLSAAASYGFLYDDVSMEAIISALMPIN
ncbi:flagellar assembly lytic transglycosylase [Breznakiellaceae bacterium SP9]